MSNHEPKKGAPLVRQLVVVNKLGIHARPAAMFVKTAARFQSEITVEKEGEAVNGKSIMGLMMLAAGCGTKLKVSAHGADAEKALDEIAHLLEAKFNED
jgi:phosphocarrier protein